MKAWIRNEQMINAYYIKKQYDRMCTKMMITEII